MTTAGAQPAIETYATAAGPFAVFELTDVQPDDVRSRCARGVSGVMRSSWQAKFVDDDVIPPGELDGWLYSPGQVLDQITSRTARYVVAASGRSLPAESGDVIGFARVQHFRPCSPTRLNPLCAPEPHITDLDVRGGNPVEANLPVTWSLIRHAVDLRTTPRPDPLHNDRAAHMYVQSTDEVMQRVAAATGFLQPIDMREHTLGATTLRVVQFTAMGIGSVLETVMPDLRMKFKDHGF